MNDRDQWNQLYIAFKALAKPLMAQLPEEDQKAIRDEGGDVRARLHMQNLTPASHISLQNMNRRSMSPLAALLIISVTFQVLYLPRLNADERSNKPMQRTQQLYDVLKTISSKRPFRTESISAAVGTPLQLNPSESNQYFQIYNGGDKEGGLFSNVEVRIPTALAKTKGGIVILTLNTAGPCVKRDDIMDQFGKEAELNPPSPHGPTDLPIYLMYPFDWGELRFSFPQRDQECLSEIVLDATRTLDQDQAR